MRRYKHNPQAKSPEVVAAMRDLARSIEATILHGMEKFDGHPDEEMMICSSIAGACFLMEQKHPGLRALLIWVLTREQWRLCAGFA